MMQGKMGCLNSSSNRFQNPRIPLLQNMTPLVSNAPVPTTEIVLFNAHDRNVHRHELASTLMLIGSYIINKTCGRISRKQYFPQERHSIWGKLDNLLLPLAAFHWERLTIRCAHFSIPITDKGNQQVVKHSTRTVTGSKEFIFKK